MNGMSELPKNRAAVCSILKRAIRDSELPGWAEPEPGSVIHVLHTVWKSGSNAHTQEVLAEWLSFLMPNNDIKRPTVQARLEGRSAFTEEECLAFCVLMLDYYLVGEGGMVAKECANRNGAPQAEQDDYRRNVQRQIVKLCDLVGVDIAKDCIEPVAQEIDLSVGQAAIKLLNLLLSDQNGRLERLYYSTQQGESPSAFYKSRGKSSLAVFIPTPTNEFIQVGGDPAKSVVEFSTLIQEYFKQRNEASEPPIHVWIGKKPLAHREDSFAREVLELGTLRAGLVAVKLRLEHSRSFDTWDKISKNSFVLLQLDLINEPELRQQLPTMQREMNDLRIDTGAFFPNPIPAELQGDGPTAYIVSIERERSADTLRDGLSTQGSEKPSRNGASVNYWVYSKKVGSIVGNQRRSAPNRSAVRLASPPPGAYWAETYLNLLSACVAHRKARAEPSSLDQQDRLGLDALKVRGFVLMDIDEFMSFPNSESLTGNLRRTGSL